LDKLSLGLLSLGEGDNCCCCSIESLVRILPSYGPMSIVSLVIMSTTEIATAVGRWNQ
jgi:hypothetical protein